jgi:hypothetical protein
MGNGDSPAIGEAQGRFMTLLHRCIDIPSTFNAGLPKSSAFVRLGSECPLRRAIFHTPDVHLSQRRPPGEQIIEQHCDREFCECLSGDLHEALASADRLCPSDAAQPDQSSGG